MSRTPIRPYKRRMYSKTQSNKRKQQRLDLIRKLGNVCLSCGNDVIECLQLDHIKAIIVNGNRSNYWKDLTNLQVLCEKCNVAKGDATIDILKFASEQ